MVTHMFDHVELEELTRKVAGADCSFASRAERLAAVHSIERARRHLDATAAHVLGSLDAEAVCEAEFGMTTGSWLAYHHTQPAQGARRRVKIATLLKERLPLVDDALAEGRIGWCHVEVFARAANPRVVSEIARLQPELLDLADVATFEQFKREVMAISDRLDVDGGHDPGRDLSRNRLTIRPGLKGVYQIDGECLDDLGAELAEAVEVEMGRLFRQFTRDEETTGGAIDVPEPSTLRMLALMELCRRGITTRAGAGSGPVTDLTVVLHDTDPGKVWLHDGTTLPVEHLECRLCDPAIRFLTMTPDGVPLNLGHEERLATPHQRRANAIRDGGCVFPGCNRPPAWTDQHHVIHAGGPADGPTDLGNLASLCRTHHGITHRTGWEMHATPDQWFWWRTPTGNTFWSQRHGRQHPERQRTGQPPPGG